MGSRRTTPTCPAAAVVVSEPSDDALNTPCSQSKPSQTRGTVSDLRPPNRIPEMGTPFGLSNSLDRVGQLKAETVKRELGCATNFPLDGSYGLPCQSSMLSGLVSVRPSHHGAFVAVMSPVLVKSVG